MDKAAIKVVLIHGNGGATASDHWFPELKRKLEERGIKVIARNFPDSLLAKKSVWLPFLKNEIGTDEATILVGHSSGAEAAMRYAEENKLLGTVLVSACYTDMGEPIERMSGYYAEPWNWKKIKENQKWIAQFGSVDDPFVPIEEQRFVSDKLESEYREFEDRGHFLMESFPEVAEVILSKLLY